MPNNAAYGIAALPPATVRLERAALSSLHVGNSYQLCGAGRVFAELCRHLPATGIRFAGAVCDPVEVNALSEGRVELFASSECNLKTRLKSGRRMVLELMERERPDILASHFALYAAPLVDKLYSRREFAFVNHFHGPWAEESLREGASVATVFAKKRLERLVYRRADRIIVLSQAFARIAAEQYDIPEHRIRIVPGCVDTNRFNTAVTRRQARQLLRLPLDRPLVVTTRRLVHRMGLHPLLDAMREVSRAVPDVELLIAGDGRLRKSLGAAIAAYSLQNHVRLLGFVPEEQLPLLYRAADLSVVPSQTLEGFGLAAVEALAVGTPCLVTPIGGLPEIVSALSPALVFPSTDSRDIANRLIEVLKGCQPLPAEAQCREWVLRNYTSQLMAERTATVYRELA